MNKEEASTEKSAIIDTIKSSLKIHGNTMKKGEFTLPNWEADWVEEKYPNCNMIKVDQVKDLFYSVNKDVELLSLTKEELMAGYSLFLCIRCAEAVAPVLLEKLEKNEDPDKALEVLNGIGTDEMKEIEERAARTSIPKISITQKYR